MLEARPTNRSDSPLAEAQARFDALNEDLALKTRALLNRFVGNDTLHPKLMNTLSMLEHMGSHKIMATQHGTEIEQATLRHLTEECHHAFFLKRQAEKSARRHLIYRPEDMVAPRAARMYFQRLEASMLRRLKSEASENATYLYMSMIVELRAIWFYGLYQQVLSRHEHPLSLKRLLGEEQNHLTEMVERLTHAGQFSDSRVDAFIDSEHALYDRLLDSLQQSLN